MSDVLHDLPRGGVRGGPHHALPSTGARERDEEFTAFVEENSAGLLRYCWMLTGRAGDADDLLQATLLKLYLHWDRVADPAARLRYAKQVATRSNISTWRRFGRRERPTDELPERAVAPFDVETGDLLWHALQGLGERQRTVLVLRFYEDLDERAIAERMGTSVGTVKSQLSRGLARLKQQMLADEVREGARR